MNKTWKDWKNVVLITFAVAMLAIIGCRSMMDVATLGVMPKRTASYNGDPNAAGLTNLSSLKEARTDAIIRHRETQRDLLREAQDDEVEYKDAIGFIEPRIEESQVVQDLMVGGEGQPFSLVGLLAGAFPALAIGRAMKRKEDLTPEEAERKFRSSAKLGRNDPDRIVGPDGGLG